NDASPVPAALRAWLADGLKILNAMTAEESAELLATVTPATVIVEVIELAAKAGARHSAGDQKHVQSMHDSAVALGAGCSAEKAAGSEGEDLAKAALQDTTTQLTKVTGERDELQKKVAAFEAQPAAPKGVAKVVGKENDGVVVAKKDEVVDNSPLALMKKAQATPQLMKL
ncbi:MAG TPA: hypothetical protein VIO35_07825, partial [Chloroflexota bacterium]